MGLYMMPSDQRKRVQRHEPPEELFGDGTSLAVVALLALILLIEYVHRSSCAC